MSAERAAGLRMAGASYTQIAEQLGYTDAAAAATVVADHLAGSARESRETQIRLDLVRLDALLMAVWKSAARGDASAVGQALKITSQRAGLLAELGGATAGDGESISVAEQLEQLKLSESDTAPVFSIVGEEVIDDG